MKVFDSKHISKGQWLSHFITASKISLLMICSGLIGLVHALVPFFLTDFLSLANARIAKELEQRMCECD
tara:strand:+ start:918 stop:1124 length:207 start_codon:yes stop_codon:yes gene_type:complete